MQNSAHLGHKALCLRLEKGQQWFWPVLHADSESQFSLVVPTLQASFSLGFFLPTSINWVVETPLAIVS